MIEADAVPPALIGACYIQYHAFQQIIVAIGDINGVVAFSSGYRDVFCGAVHRASANLYTVVTVYDCHVIDPAIFDVEKTDAIESGFRYNSS